MNSSPNGSTIVRSLMLPAILLLLSTPAMRADTDYASAIPKLEAAVRDEIKNYGIGGISIALTDGQRLVHAAGYGEAERDSVFRAGSVSKLFNAVAVMQLAEQ